GGAAVDHDVVRITLGPVPAVVSRTARPVTPPPYRRRCPQDPPPLAHLTPSPCRTRLPEVPHPSVTSPRPPVTT
ncbi:hypothetical protein ACWCQV_32300, partial [Streptomyces eurythermus]